MKTEHWIFIVIALILGFFIGRRTVDVEEKIRYIKGETIVVKVPSKNVKLTDELAGNVLYLPKFYWVRDTIDNIIIEKPDTVKVFDDFMVERSYDVELFNNDTLGYMSLQAKVQYNRLQDVGYTITPIQKEVTRVIQRKFTPFATIGYSTNSNAIVGGGLYINSVGLEYNYNLNVDNRADYVPQNKSYHTIKLNYKF